MADEEAAVSVHTDRKRGGWSTFPFIIIALTGLTVSASGWMSNLIVYFIEQFNIKSVQAAQISNVINGSSSFLPIAGAILADSLLGNFLVISISSLISLLGLILLTLSATLHSLQPPQCDGSGLEGCKGPSATQFVVLYTAITLVAIGMGGTRFTIASMGADQFDNARHQGKFFNWFFCCLYAASVIGITAIVYVESDVSWGLGFGLCFVINAVGLAVFVAGKAYYRHVKPKGSPFTKLAKVIVASIRKKKVVISSESNDYYYGEMKDTKYLAVGPTTSFRFLNKAAIKTEGDKKDAQLTESWSLCTVQQVEDLKSLIRIFPIWSSSIFLSIPIGIQSSFMVIQVLSMDRHLGPRFEIPAGSFLIFILLASAISLSIIDLVIFPIWKKVRRHSMTPLERIGIGHVLNIIGMAVSAIVEARRLSVARSHNLTHKTGTIVPMLALWLVAPLAIVGVGEAFHFPGQVALYYQEFPVSLKSTATAMISLIVALGFYLSTAIIDLIQTVTGWLPDNINEARLDNVFWLMVVIGVINFGYFIGCAMLYTYKNVEDSEEKSNSG